jgi:hypothetical protein
VSDGNIFYGWFDDADQESPIYQPPRNAPRPFCRERVRSDDVRNLMYQAQCAAIRLAI